MSTPNDGGPAFPFPADTRNFAPSVGMSLRDYFAAHVPCNWDDIDNFCQSKFKKAITDVSFAEAFEAESVLRYRKADAMLAARKGGAD